MKGAKQKSFKEIIEPVCNVILKRASSKAWLASHVSG